MKKTGPTIAAKKTKYKQLDGKKGRVDAKYAERGPKREKTPTEIPPGNPSYLRRRKELRQKEGGSEAACHFARVFLLFF